jgi:putative transposase
MQLLHLSRYIHLNPVTAHLVENPEDYPFSSYKAYLGLMKLDFINPDPILNEFKSKDGYKKFVMLQKDYQRKLGKIKMLTLENQNSFYG